MTIPLGTVVRCRVTGLTGVAENRTTWLYGCDRYCVQPKATEAGTVPEAVMVDEPQLEILDQTAVMLEGPPPKQLVPLGSQVKDSIRGQSGTATGRATYLNGCARILIEAKKKGDAAPDCWWAPEEQLEVKKRAPQVPEDEVPLRKTGGPVPSSSKY